MKEERKTGCKEDRMKGGQDEINEDSNKIKYIKDEKDERKNR
jgi:hypothetical protein